MDKRILIGEIIQMTKRDELKWVPKSYDGGTCYVTNFKGKEIRFDPSSSLPCPFGVIIIDNESPEEIWISVGREQGRELKKIFELRRTNTLKGMFPNAFKS